MPAFPALGRTATGLCRRFALVPCRRASPGGCLPFSPRLLSATLGVGRLRNGSGTALARRPFCSPCVPWRVVSVGFCAIRMRSSPCPPAWEARRNGNLFSLWEEDRKEARKARGDCRPAPLVCFPWASLVVFREGGRVRRAAVRPRPGFWLSPCLPTPPCLQAGRRRSGTRAGASGT